MHEDIPIVTSHALLISLKDEVPKSAKDLEANQGTFVGFVSEVTPKGVIVRFMDGLKKLIVPKDLET